MKRILIIVAAMIFVNSAAHATGAYQLSGAIQITNPGATRKIGDMTVEYNQRHPDLNSCNAAKTAAIQGSVNVYPANLAAHYGEFNKIVHLSCLPISVE